MNDPTPPAAAAETLDDCSSVLRRAFERDIARILAALLSADRRSEESRANQAQLAAARRSAEALGGGQT